MKKIFYTIVIIPALLTHSLLLSSWSSSIKETAHNGYEYAASFLERTKKDVATDEYDVDPKSTIIVDNSGHTGNITIQSWNRPAVIIEAEKKGVEKNLPNTAFLVTKEKKQLTIKTTCQKATQPLPINYSLIVPENASVQIITDSGTITIRDIKGTISAQTNAGNIIIENGKNSLRAHAPQGSVTVEQTELPLSANIFIESYKATKLTLPATVDANITARTLAGKVTSELLITLDPITTQLNKAAWKRMQQEVKGILGAGGPPITVDVTKGNVILLEG